jgi:flagellar basal-body rod protein FlgG
MYLMMKQPGAQTANSELAPAGIFVGLGTKLSNTQLDTTQGSLDSTGRPLDVAIQGEGFFKVKVLDTIGNGFAYTRNGAFFVNDQGELVVGMGDGYRLQPPITIPPGSTNITISQDGQVSYTKPGTTASTVAGQMQISQFINPQGLDLLGGSLYLQTDASGAPVDSNPGENGAGQTMQNYLEESNVDPVKELVTLIKTQRSFELNSQSIQTADQALQTITNLRRS